MQKKRAYNFIDLSGKKFGNWTILKSTNEYKDGFVVWLGKCACGTIKKVSKNSLTAGSKSCGCSKLHRKKKRRSWTDRFNNLISSIYARYRIEAHQRGFPYEINKEQFKVLITQPCYYCGLDKQNCQVIHNVPVRYTGIDRVDNDKGYTISNCVPCCRKCNSKKKATSATMILKAYEFLKNNGTF